MHCAAGNDCLRLLDMGLVVAADPIEFRMIGGRHRAENSSPATTQPSRRFGCQPGHGRGPDISVIVLVTALPTPRHPKRRRQHDKPAGG